MLIHIGEGIFTLSQVSNMSRRKLVLLGSLLVGCLGAGFLYRAYWQAVHHNDCRNNLKQIGLAMHNYASAYGTLPPRVTRDAKGNLLHSWRTLLLPYIEQKALYDKIDLSKPWNDPANADAMAQQVTVYQCPANGEKGPKCHYFGIEGSDSALADNAGVAFVNILDSRSRTLIAVESREGIASWGEPVDVKAEDIQIDVNQPGSLISSRHSSGAGCVCCDGTVEYLPKGWKAQAVRDACTKSGFELAVMPSQMEVTPEDVLLQKFIEKGGPFRTFEFSKPSDPEEVDADIYALDWVELNEQIFIPDRKRQILAAHANFDQTGHQRFLVSATYSESNQMDAARYWFQEAIVEEGLMVGETNSARNLLSSFRESGKEVEALRNQLELFAKTSFRYWKQAKRAKPKLHLPANYDPKQSIPLVVCLHPDRLSPSFWEDAFCAQLADGLNVAVVIPAGTEHYGPDRYHWTAEFATQYEPDHDTIEKAASEFKGKFQEMQGSRILVGLHQSYDLVLAITGKHHDQYASAVLIHPNSIMSSNDQSRAFIQAATEQTSVKQRLLVLHEPEQYRKNLANFIAKTLAPTGRKVELKVDDDASFEYPKKLTSESELAPRILDAIRAVLTAR